METSEIISARDRPKSANSESIRDMSDRPVIFPNSPPGPSASSLEEIVKTNSVGNGSTER